MRTTAGLIHSTTAAAATPAASFSSPTSAAMISIDRGMVVTLASLLCAVICLTGLALVARCACRRALRPSLSTGSITTTSPLPPRGLKKKAIDALPVTAAAPERRQEQCAICLVDFAAEEELRVLPRCGHAFHVSCVDAWLRARAICPSCRATILDPSSPPAPPLPSPGRCRRCGAACNVDDNVAASAAAAAAAAAAARDDESSFLP